MVENWKVSKLVSYYKSDKILFFQKNYKNEIKSPVIYAHVIVKKKLKNKKIYKKMSADLKKYIVLNLFSKNITVYILH